MAAHSYNFFGVRTKGNQCQERALEQKGGIHNMGTNTLTEKRTSPDRDEDLFKFKGKNN